MIAVGRVQLLDYLNAVRLTMNDARGAEMSDPVSNHDIEDVLSSIRRLVAQGNPRQTVPRTPDPAPIDVSISRPPATEPAAPKPAPAIASPERFLLTPALRIEADEPVTPLRPEPALPVATAAPTSSRASLEATIACLLYTSDAADD